MGPRGVPCLTWGLGASAPTTGEPPLIELVMLDQRPVRAPAHVPPTGASATPSRRAVAGDLVVARSGGVRGGGVIAAALQRDGGDDAVSDPATTSVPTTTRGHAVDAWYCQLSATSRCRAPGMLVPTTTIAPGTPVSAGRVGSLVRSWRSVPNEMTVLDLGNRSSSNSAGPSEQRTAFNEATDRAGRSFVYTRPRRRTGRCGRSASSDPSATTPRRPDASMVAKSIGPGALLGGAAQRGGVKANYRVAEIDVEGRRSTTLTRAGRARVAGAHATGLWLTGSGRIYSMTSRAERCRQSRSARWSTPRSPVCSTTTARSPDRARCSCPRHARRGSRIGPTADLAIARSSINSDSSLVA